MALADLVSSGTVKEVMSGIDALTTSAEERGKIKLDLVKNVLETERAQFEAQAKIITAEAQGQGVLQRSWRPIGMLVFIFIVAYNYVIRDLLGMVLSDLPELAIPPGMWNLLTVGFGGYVVGRSAEKIAKSVAGTTLFASDKMAKRTNKALLKQLKRAQKEGDTKTVNEVLKALGRTAETE